MFHCLPLQLFQHRLSCYDKHHKNIYEHDILEIKPKYKNDKILRVCVVFLNGAFRDDKYHYPLSEWDLNHMEVIGNIYENPELLTKEETLTQKGKE